jgi:hypothetical protein
MKVSNLTFPNSEKLPQKIENIRKYTDFISNGWKFIEKFL